MENRKETLSVAIYLYNRFNLDEAVHVFGKCMGEHIFNKFIERNRDMLRFICDIDEENYEKLIERACSIYCGRKTR